MKRTPLRRRSKNPRKKLINKLDLLFSKMIRERDKRKPCIDMCGRTGVMQAGHFRRRECMSTRWNPKNVNSQTAYCNAFDNDLYRHAKGIDERWGKGTAEVLYKLSQQQKQWSIAELEELILAAEVGYEEYEKTYFELSTPSIAVAEEKK